MAQDFEKLNIQWFPGHMTKAQRMIEEHMKQVDAVCEILDARIPMASRNPDIDRLAGDKPRIVVLNRTDLADPKATARWHTAFQRQSMTVLETDSRSGKGVNGFAGAVRTALRDKIEAYAAKGQVGRPVRVMVLGIPNVGKSTFINKVARRKAAAAGDRPGVTRGKQWITVDQGLELLDTPGILWPRFDSQEVGELLAITGAIKAEVLDRETLAANFMLRLARFYPDAVEQRYKFRPDPACNGFELLEQALPDFQFIEALPGKKILLKGNHDFWWSTAKKAYSFFAAHDMHTMDILNNNCYFYGDYAICGTRGWFYEEARGEAHDRKIMLREVGRLETSLKAAGDKMKLVFLHYPPKYLGYECPEILDLLDAYHVPLCCYGHIHSRGCRSAFQGMYHDTEFRLLSADYISFCPRRILP